MTETAFEDEAAGLPARRFAFSLVTRVLDQRVTLDEASQALATVAARMPGRDAAFGRAIAYAALRHKGSLEEMLRHFIPRPLPEHGISAARVLLCAAAELMILDGKAHAAVDGAVRLAVATRGAKPFKSLINAVLRRIAENGRITYAAIDAPSWDTPEWLWSRWAAAYGETAAHGIAAAHGAPAPLDLTLRERADTAQWQTALNATVLGAASLRLAESAPVETLPGFAEGAWWVQDAAAAIPARVLLDALGGGAGHTIIDLCAAPGGKTLQLAAAGARVTAVDSSAPRLKRLGANLARLDLDAAIVTADARTWRPDAPADAVLLDAPCSATGTIRRHPELPWIRDVEAVTRNAAISAALLDAAWTMVKPGGVLVFAVCSLEPEEGETQLDAFRTRQPDAVPLPIAAAPYGLPETATKGPYLRILPSMLADAGGLDGFFVAALSRGPAMDGPFSGG
ncbi:Ribosomal RNA small subunit methyltransferase B [Alphaproteobacteria bacterium SO-S41]|nr:Ribosomal RNA small subunit methyltransferase B [Alphaproteobacteria bacterium SO-S41]